MKFRAVSLGSVAFAALFAGGAFAADLPVRSAAPAPVYYVAPIFSWTGFYVGAHIGGAWGDKDFTRIDGSGGEEGNGQVRSFDIDGMLAGGQIGYNFQTGNFVFGIEGDFAWTGVDGGFSGRNNNGPASWNADMNWLGMLTGRVGYAFNNVLVYIKGGAAWADEDYTHPATGGQLQALYYSGGKTRSGWTIGGGVEYAFTPNWSFKVEYNYVDFGSKNSTLSEASSDRWVTFDVDQKMHVVKAGVNYRFGSAVAAPVVARY